MEGISVVNFGTIEGGLSGDGVTRANAITFNAGGFASVLQIDGTSVIVGNVVVTGGGTATLDMAGAGTNSFDMSNVGAAAQYRGFNQVMKTTSSTWVLSGATAETLNWRIDGGTFAVASDATLGTAAGSLTFGTGGGTGGTLRWDASFDTARTVTLDSGGSNLNTNGFTATMSGTIGGVGRLRKTGAGTLTLTGVNTYQGGTAVNGGTLSVSANANLGDATGNIGFNGGTLQTTASFTTARNVVLNGAGTFETATGTTLTVGGTISNTGSLAKTGAGTLVLTGASTYTGATTVNAGTLALSGGGTIATSSGLSLAAASAVFDISGGSGNKTIQALSGVAGSTVRLGNNSLTVGSATSTSFAGVIDAFGGGGGLVKQGTGTLTLTGINTYTGGTTVNAGALSVSADNNLGAAAGSLTFGGGTLRTTASFATSRTTTLNAGGGTFSADLGTTLTHNGAIGGTGPLVKTGDGTLVLGGSNNYTGGTTVSAGTLAGTTASLQGAIVNNAAVTFDQSTDGTYAGAMSGSGSLTKAGTGTLTLTGTNSYSGGTTVSGGILQGTTDSLQGAITNNANVTFNQSGVYAGVMSGSGSLTKSGGGTVTLTGTNTYSGGTTVNGGALSVSSDANLGNAAGGLALASGTLQTTASFATSRATTLSGVGGAFDTATGTTLTHNGVIGGGGLFKFGGGTMVLGGANTFASATVVGGTLQVSADDNLGTGGLILDNGTLQTTASFTRSGNVLMASGGGTFNADAATTLTLSGDLGGAGNLTKTGAGTLVLAGTASYTGSTTVSAGTLQGSTSTLRGDILNNAAVVFDQATTGTYAGNMSGTGSLTKTGVGVMTLAGVNSYTGGTTVSGGILQGDSTSLQGNILNNANVTFNQAGTGTYGGAMSGNGSLTKSGVGTLILTGTNSYSGGTTVSGGILQGNSASLQGNIVNNAMVAFNQTSNGTYAGAMSGTGGLTLQGGGVLTITGNNLYSGATNVMGSGLVVNGSLASTVTLDGTSTLGGTGTIGGLVSNGGIVAPGNSIGTMTVNGNFSQSGGTYVVEANAQGQSDRVNVTGNATINGATVQVQAASGSYGTSTTYTILNATGGVSGTYSGVTSNLAFLTPSLAYDASNVFLTLALQGAAFSGFGGNTVNQRAVGGALDQNYASATGDFATVIGALAGLTNQQAPYALNQISGQPYADFGTANLASNTLFMNALGQQMAVARGGAGSGQRLALAQACEIEACDGASPFSVWASGLGGFGSVQGDGNSSTFTYNLGGAAAGIDYRVMPNLLLGIGAGYTSGTQWTDSFSGKGWTNAVSVAAYGSFTMAGFYADLLAGYAYSGNQLQRQVTVPGLQPRTANGSTGANQVLGQAEIGYQVPVYAPAQASITPFARLQVMSVNQAAFNEWGANSLSLNVQQQTTNSLRSTLGAQLNGAIGLGDTRTLDMALRLGWLHEYAYTGRPVTAAFAGAPASAFTVYGATPQRDAAAIGFQASTNVAAATQIFFRYDGDIGSGTDNHALNLGLRLSW